MTSPTDPTYPTTPTYPTSQAYDPYAPGYATTPSPVDPTYGTTTHDDRRRPRTTDTMTREVTAGPFRFGLREGVMGTIGIFAILGLVLGVLGFAAAFALDNAAEAARDGNNNGGLDGNDIAAGAAALPSILVGLLPFMAAPVLALGLGSWAGHASRDAGLGASAGAIGGFVGPIVMLLLAGVGFALGAGAANLDLSGVTLPYGVAPGWGNTIPYLFTGAGLLWLLANTLAGGLSGGLVGGLLQRRWGADRTSRRDHTRRTTRY
ncbi:MAG TPA: hypothetical protein VM370_03520 [Candidatus Thermoplasmatota archaeon]|nr:hypothetical protein [Candidatus Thermoplasmatota archaeon]